MQISSQIIIFLKKQCILNVLNSSFHYMKTKIYNSINNLFLGNDNIFPPIHMILDNMIHNIQKCLVFFYNKNDK